MGKLDKKEVKLPFESHSFPHYPGIRYLCEAHSDAKCLVSARLLYKYVDLYGLRLMLKSGLQFKEPDQWYDGFERRFYHADYSALRGTYSCERVFACCFTTNKNSEASWKSYANLDDLIKLIGQDMKQSIDDYRIIARITIDRAALRRQLSKFLRDNRATIYESPVQYVSSYAMEKCHEPGHNGVSRLHSSLFENSEFNRDVFLSLLSMKRREVFEYEKEIRYFYVPEDYITDSKKTIPLRWDEIIKKVSLVRFGCQDRLTSEEIARLNIPFDPTLIESVDLYHTDKGEEIHIITSGA